MAAMTAPPHVDSVQTSTSTAWRAARGRSARGFGQKRTWFESALAGARGSATRPRGPATLAPPPAHTLPAARPPRNRAHAKHTPRQHTPRLRNSELAPAGRRGARAAAPPSPRLHHTPSNTRPKKIADTRRATQNRNRAGPRHSPETSPASPRTTTTSTSSSATARRRSSATTRSRAASRSSATAWTASISSRTCHVSVFSARFRTSSCGDGVDATGGHRDAIDAASERLCVT